ncbi:MAG: FHA domain-containing protein [Sandaracinaceae bacterium]|nr:FHA domain-containing protein [Sandaracinaceae bacterium]
MAVDQNKKTVRSFQCREYLWEVFERMSGELDCSVDYLINEAMRQYARSRGVRTSRASLSSINLASSPSLSERAPEMSAPAASVAPASVAPPARPSVAPTQDEPFSVPPPKAPPLSSPGLAPPPLPSMPPPAHVIAQQRPPLYLIFNGQKTLIDKDEFIIGRGSKSSDFTIKDGNISRRHAMIVFHNGHYYMKDLGSTNGIDFAGQRVGTKLIDEGDVFRICDYELRFTYR